MLVNGVSRVNCISITLGTLGNLEVAFGILSLTAVPLRGRSQKDRMQHPVQKSRAEITL